MHSFSLPNSTARLCPRRPLPHFRSSVVAFSGLHRPLPSVFLSALRGLRSFVLAVAPRPLRSRLSQPVRRSGRAAPGTCSCWRAGRLAPDLPLYLSPLPRVCPDSALFSGSSPACWPCRQSFSARCSAPVKTETWRHGVGAPRTPTEGPSVQGAAQCRAGPREKFGTAWAGRKAFTEQGRQLEQ